MEMMMNQFQKYLQLVCKTLPMHSNTRHLNFAIKKSFLTKHIYTLLLGTSNPLSLETRAPELNTPKLENTPF